MNTRLQMVYLGEIARQLRRRIRGETYPGPDYEPGRQEYLERLFATDWTFDDFVFGERQENFQDPTVIGLLDGALTFDHSAVRGRLLAELTATIGRWNPATVTEVGAGTGRNLVWLARELGVACRGVELTAAGTAAGNLAAEKFGLALSMTQGDITDRTTPIPDADVVCSVHALEQIPEPSEVVRRMIGAARKAVVMYEPFPDFWPSGLGRVAHRLRADWLDRLRPGALDGLDYTVRRMPFGTALNRAAMVEITVRN